MKNCFSNYRSKGWLTKRQIRWWLVSLICFLGGSYFVLRYFGLVAFVVFVIAGVVMAIAAIVCLIAAQERVHPIISCTEDTPEITETWRYRPRGVNRRDKASESEGVKALAVADSSSSARKDSRDVWFDFMGGEASSESVPPSSDTVN